MKSTKKRALRFESLEGRMMLTVDVATITPMAEPENNGLEVTYLKQDHDVALIDVKGGAVSAKTQAHVQHEERNGSLTDIQRVAGTTVVTGMVSGTATGTVNTSTVIIGGQLNGQVAADHDVFSDVKVRQTITEVQMSGVGLGYFHIFAMAVATEQVVNGLSEVASTFDNSLINVNLLVYGQWDISLTLIAQNDGWRYLNVDHDKVNASYAERSLAVVDFDVQADYYATTARQRAYSMRISRWDYGDENIGSTTRSAGNSSYIRAIGKGSMSIDAIAETPRFLEYGAGYARANFARSEVSVIFSDKPYFAQGLVTSQSQTDNGNRRHTNTVVDGNHLTYEYEAASYEAGYTGGLGAERYNEVFREVDDWLLGNLLMSL